MSLLLLFRPRTGAVADQTLSLSVQMDFGSGFVDVTDDVIAADGLTLEYGIPSNGPLDRIASSGTLTFSLRNDAGNSGGVVGYYSPQSSNCRSGFTFGIPVRVIFTFEGVSRTKFVGQVYVIDPVPGSFGPRRTYCTAHDYMYQLAETDLREITPQLEQTETQLLTAVLNALPATVQPTATDFDTGLDTYPFAFDDLQKGVKATTALVRVMNSAWGKLVCKGNGTLAYLNRQNGLLQSVSAEIDNEMNVLEVPSDRTLTYDVVRVTGHPKTISTTNTTVLCALPTTETPEFAAGETKEFWLPYRNPNNEDLKAGGSEFQNPLTATTDYTANTLANGTGTNQTANFTVTVSAFASTAKFTITNNSGATAYLTKLQLRGRAIYDVTPVTQEAEGDTDERVLEIDCPYQDDVNVLQALADFVLQEYEGLTNHVTAVGFSASRSADLTRYALDIEPGDLVELSETVTGLNMLPATVHHVSLTVGSNLILSCRWGLAPRTSGHQWILDDAALSILDSTTIPSYV